MLGAPEEQQLRNYIDLLQQQAVVVKTGLPINFPQPSGRPRPKKKKEADEAERTRTGNHSCGGRQSGVPQRVSFATTAPPFEIRGLQVSKVSRKIEA